MDYSKVLKKVYSAVKSDFTLDTKYLTKLRDLSRSEKVDESDANNIIRYIRGNCSVKYIERVENILEDHWGLAPNTPIGTPSLTLAEVATGEKKGI